MLEKLRKARVKYADYLEDNKHFVGTYQANNTNDSEQKITELAFLEVNVKTAYPSVNFVQLFSENLSPQVFLSLYL